jgi:Leu/Phe-tRNA-protein transferase
MRGGYKLEPHRAPAGRAKMTDAPQSPKTPLANLPPHLMLRHLTQMFSEGAYPAPPETPAQIRAKRLALFNRSLVGRGFEILRGLSPFLKYAPISASAALIDFLVREKAIGRAGLPEASQALPAEHAFAGLAGLAPDLTPDAIVEGYASGLTLDARAGAPAWWAPRTRALADPGMVAAVLAPQAISHTHRFSFDSNFEIVLRACRRGGLALDAKLMMAFCALFDLGLAHSWEARDAQGGLRAGGVGLAIGRAFLCLNGFARDVESGRFGLAHLAAHLETWDYAILEANALELACPEVVANACFGAADHDSLLALLSLHMGGGRTRLHWKAEDAIAASLRPAPHSLRSAA